LQPDAAIFRQGDCFATFDIHTMPRNFSRHEQFLRIFALLEILSNARQPLDDQSLIAQLMERLGLSRLSSRTLHRDCDFLVSCGYPVDHLPLPGIRRYGWQMVKDTAAGRQIPPEPLTLLELVAFMVGRDLLRTFEGTILWSGIESLRHKIERGLPEALVARLEGAKQVFHVKQFDPARYASRPRLISTLSAAITDCREIEIDERPDAAGSAGRRRLRPLRLVIEPPRVQLLGLDVAPDRADPPVFIDIDRIDKVTPLDVTFTPPAIDPEALLAARGTGG
jgi:predicted DNA-binding transcriptional regulator YafY